MFQEWFATQIATQLDDNTQQVNNQQVDMRLSIMKPLGARWLVEMYDHLCANPSFTVSGFSAAGILKLKTNTNSIHDMHTEHYTH